jgi:hypothetical protein
MKRMVMGGAALGLLSVMLLGPASDGPRAEMLGLDPRAAKGLYLNSHGGDETDDVITNVYPGLGWGARGIDEDDYVIRVSGDGSVVATRTSDLPGFFAPLNSGLEIYDLKTTTAAGNLYFARSTTGTYVGADGLIHTASIDEPRFGYTDLSAGTFGGLLHESGSTNHALYSEAFENWSGVSVSVNADAAPSPVFGNSTSADSISASDASGYLWQNTESTASGYHSFSVYIRADEPVSVGHISLGKPADGYTNYTTAVGVEWRRYEVDANFANSSQPVEVRIFPNQTTVGIYAFGAQLEQLGFPTSYMPTASTTVTRGSDRTWFAEPAGFDDAGTIVMHTTFLWADADVLTDNRHLVNWAGGTGAQANTQSMLYQNGATTNSTTVGTNDGTATSTTTVNQLRGVPYRFCLRWGGGQVSVHRDSAVIKTGTYDGGFSGTESFSDIGLMYRNYGFMRGLVLFGHDDAEVTQW